MAPPWSTSTKTVNLSGNTGHAHPHFPSPGFTPVPLRSAISFPPTGLYAALAKTSVLGTAPALLAAALTASDRALVEAIVDDVGADFSFTADAEQIGDDLRKALAGRIGAALCHLYMDQLGYAWLDFASSYIKVGNPLGDFLYDGASCGSSGLALAEAKGSFRAPTSQRAVARTADAAYRVQVQPHLGHATSAGKIEYGCAIASSIVPASAMSAGGVTCFLHVAETTAAVAGPGGGASSANQAGVGDSDLAAVNCRLALINYRGVLRLINAPYMVDFLDALIGGQPLPEGMVQRFGRVNGPGFREDWVLGDGDRHPLKSEYARLNKSGRDRFALHERSFNALMALIKRCARDRELLKKTVRMPNLAMTRNRDGHAGEEREDMPDRFVPFVMGDGLAIVPYRGARFPDMENFTWPSRD